MWGDWNSTCGCEVAQSLVLLQISASLFSTSKGGFEIAPEKQSQILLAGFSNWLLCCQSYWLLCQTIFHQAVGGCVEEGAARCLVLVQSARCRGSVKCC